MLSRIPSLVTPDGNLIIDCLGIDDWENLSDALVQSVAQLGAGQAHLFGLSREVLEKPEIGLLVRTKKLVAHDLGLREALGTLTEEQFSKLSEENQAWKEGVAYSFPSGKRHVFEPNDWRRMTNGLTLLTDDDCKRKKQFSSDDDKYRAFREFLYGTRGVPDWSAYTSGLTFKRQEFSDLFSTVTSSLKSSRLVEKPILITG